MSNELEKKFSTYLKKHLKGYSNRQKLKYLRNINIETDLTETNITKVSFINYSLGQENSLENLDVDYKHPEKAFSDPKYYKAMKKVPSKQKQALYLLVVDEFTVKEVAKILETSPRNVNILKQQAIKNFKKSLGELE